jgi:hypothetical protein
MPITSGGMYFLFTEYSLSRFFLRLFNIEHPPKTIFSTFHRNDVTSAQIGRGAPAWLRFAASAPDRLY